MSNMPTHLRTRSERIGLLSAPQPDPSSHSGLSALRRHATLREQVRVALRDAILDLQFQPGQRITENMLCRLTGVSRTVVREALRHLESEGLVKLIPARGMFVTDFSADDIRHCYEIYGAVEGQAARAFAQRASSEVIAKLRSALNGILSARRARKTNEFLNKVNSFQDLLLAECTNPLIQQVANPISGRIKYFRAILLSRRSAASNNLSGFAEIVAAIEKHDAEKADIAARRRSASECEAVLGVICLS
jgi:DNA-binding GntR family transcriptional regulator